MESILIIIAVNLFIFLSVNVRPDLLNSLALTPAEVWSHPWQLITSAFTHREIFHIFANMFTLYFFGTAVMQLLGTRRFWIIYLVGGVMGSLFFVALSSLTGTRYVSAIGASGAVFALGGVLAVLRPQMRVVVFPIPVPLPLWVAVLGGFAILSFFRGIAWQAHLGGLLFGVVAGYFFRQRRY
ncbi:MAG: rhomboid family intramembrane serine protease [Dehalococcoidia bacterium]|nr:rhomboid family intramembrane serine protease [Dehalococcoidia bacterium]